MYPGQRVQVDVKVVPAACIVGSAEGQKFYQDTAIDEFSRYRYLEAFEEQSTYSSAVFIEHMLKAFPFPVECVQTDNEYFYAVHKFYSFDDFKDKLKVHSRRYNNFPMRPLGWKSPKDTLFDFLTCGVTYV